MESKLGPQRGKAFEGDQRLTQTFPSSYAPPADSPEAVFEHLEFALRYEGVDLAALAAIFAQVDPASLSEWVKRRPNGKYVRKLGFLFEWLTGRDVPLDETSIAGAYEPILDEDLYFTGRSQNITRWHVRDNLPGTSAWCPTIHRATLRNIPIGTLDIAAALRDARDRVPPEVFERALSYAYLAETQASYAIERDPPTPTQRHAFLRALQSPERWHALGDEANQSLRGADRRSHRRGRTRGTGGVFAIMRASPPAPLKRASGSDAVWQEF